MQDIFSKRFIKLDTPYGISFEFNKLNKLLPPEESYTKYMSKQLELKELLSNMICILIIPGECNQDENIDDLDIDQLLKALAECINRYFKKYKDDIYCKPLKKIMEEIFNHPLIISNGITNTNTSKHTIEDINYSILSESDKIFLKKSFINICIYLMEIFGNINDEKVKIEYKNSQKNNLLAYILIKFQSFLGERNLERMERYENRIYSAFENFNGMDIFKDMTESRKYIALNMANPEYTYERLELLLELLYNKQINVNDFYGATELPDYIPRKVLPSSGGGKSRRNRTRKNNSLKKKNKKTLKK